MVIDRKRILPKHAYLLNDGRSTIVFNEQVSGKEGATQYIQLPKEQNWIQDILRFSHQQQIQSILVEGGASLLQSFLDSGCWDEIRVIKSTKAIDLSTSDGVKAPSLNGDVPYSIESIGADSIWYFKRNEL
jgi:diaminohydroxyphosphoribosylaminopyrimidine deaminase/5-amino-6-(5-phosphoribosylamino)uracil reductase